MQDFHHIFAIYKYIILLCSERCALSASGCWRILITERFGRVSNQIGFRRHLFYLMHFGNSSVNRLECIRFIIALELFSYQMLYSLYRMINHHPGTRPSHHRPHLLTHVRLITMNRAFLAGRLLIPELAHIQTGLGITQQLQALRTKFLVTFMSSAVEPDHHPHRLLLALYPVHHIINIILPSAKQKVCGAWVTT